MFDKHILINAMKGSLRKLNPKTQLKNPVMFVVFIGSILTTILFFNDLTQGTFNGFNFQIAIWLWFTVLFANFAEAIAEGRGKAQAESLRKLKTNTFARKFENGIEARILSSQLKTNDLVICEANDTIPSDGEVVEGIATNPRKRWRQKCCYRWHKSVER